MPVYKDGNNGTFYVQCYYRDARGSKRHKTKRGFSSEVEAAVGRASSRALTAGMDMTLSEFVEVYASEVKPRVREHTWITKEYIINDKLVPFFGDMRMCDVRPIDVIRWQNELTEHRDADGKPWAPTYLRTVNNQLNAIFNHAERYYGLTDNPVRRVDKIGSKKGGEMQFWTKDEYLRFSEAVMDKPLSFHAFELLYWTGIRCGELLALTPSDFMLESSRLRINKSYQSLHGVDTVTDPKTPKSVRTIVMPAFLRDEMADFIEMRDDVAPDERLFAVTKHFLAHEMERGCKASGVKRIRIHDIRHSHVSLLIEMGFSALAIAERMGHEAVDITYRYAHLFPTKQDEMAAALDGARGVRRMPCDNSARRRSKTMAFRCTPEERKLICDMAAWSGMSRQDYIIAKLTDTQVVVKPSVGVQKALKDSMAELTKEVRLAASYGELSESLQQRELVMGFFLALGEPDDTPAVEALPRTTPLEEPTTGVVDVGSDTVSIFEMGRR
ncbi:MAG: tyrosine-type recombinase/integrase [Adlercreutzia equolifaciens]